MNMYCYMATELPDTDKFKQMLASIDKDLYESVKISQVFFYANAVVVASLENYSEQLAKLIEIADDKNIDLFVCSAGFDKRSYAISDIAQQDFKFMGLGQFIAESAQSKLRVF